MGNAKHPAPTNTNHHNHHAHHTDRTDEMPKPARDRNRPIQQRPIPGHWQMLFDQKGIRSAAHLAEIAGIAPMTANRLVHGDNRTHPDILRKVAQAIRVDDAVIYGLAGWPKDTKPWTPPLEAEAMTDRQRKAVTEMIRSFVQPTVGPDGTGPSRERPMPVPPAQDEVDMAAWKRDHEGEPSFGEYLDGLGEEPQG